MSGSNPFRPKNTENPTAHQPQHLFHQSFSSPSTAPDPIFFAPSSTTPAPQPRHSPTPPAIVAPDIDESVTSDDLSTADPFHQGSDLSDNERDDGERTESEASIAAPSGDRRSQEPIHSAPLSVSSSSPQSPAATLSRNESSGTGHKEWLAQIDGSGNLRESPLTASSNVSLRSSISQREAEASSLTEDTRPTARTGFANRPISLIAEIDSRALASRAGNREKIPPPPPKSHHGKLISPDTARTPVTPQTTVGKAANRISYHAPSPGASLSPQPPQSAVDYFTRPTGSQSAPSSESLRRSQSQHKRPPTPPLSRRHSQMRRSKSTLAKPVASRLAMPPAQPKARASPPSSPGPRSLTPARGENARIATTAPDESPTSTPPELENPAATSFLHTSEAPGLTSRPASKRASVAGSLPPPPPPRRSRGSGNHGSDHSRTPSRPEQRADGYENFVPHPSNARDILADLTRLQKEVDDLRGHYENRRGS